MYALSASKLLQLQASLQSKNAHTSCSQKLRRRLRLRTMKMQREQMQGLRLQTVESYGSRSRGWRSSGQSRGTQR